MPATKSSIELYDTTLRDGSQAVGISFSVEDKLRIARKLDEIGITYIEGDWPGSNPKDTEFFLRAKSLPLRHATITAFSSTRRGQQYPCGPLIHLAHPATWSFLYNGAAAGPLRACQTCRFGFDPEKGA